MQLVGTIEEKVKLVGIIECKLKSKMKLSFGEYKLLNESLHIIISCVLHCYVTIIR